MKNKVIVAPDSFKGSLSAFLAANAIEETFKSDFEVVKMPIADGGEGTLDVIINSVKGKKTSVRVLSPDFREIDAEYGILNNGAAIIELAQSSGLNKQLNKTPLASSTYGFGQLILAAINSGARDITLTLGGSATTDGGTGMAAALGARFLDGSGKEITPTGGNLICVKSVDLTNFDKRVKECRFTVMSDVTNVLYGNSGAAYVFSKQKGATDEEIEYLDRGLKNYADVLQKTFGKDFSTLVGGGAAGGTGAGAAAFLNAEIKSGIEGILSLCGFNQEVQSADLIITGEGRLDNQSFMGKVLSGIIARSNGKRIYAIVGAAKADEELLNKNNVRAFAVADYFSPKLSYSDTYGCVKAVSEIAKDAYIKEKC